MILNPGSHPTLGTSGRIRFTNASALVVCITSVGLTEPSCDMVICQITESVEVTNLGTPTPFDQSRSCDVQTELNSDATMISGDDAQSMQ